MRAESVCVSVRARSQQNLVDIVADAVVNTTNERLNDRVGVSGLIFQRAGPDLVLECGRLDVMSRTRRRCLSR